MSDAAAKARGNAGRSRLVFMCGQLFLAFVGGLTGILVLHFEFGVDVLSRTLQSPQNAYGLALPGSAIDAEITEKHLAAVQRAMHRAALQGPEPIDANEAPEQASSADQQSATSSLASSKTSFLAAIPERWRYWEYCGGSVHCAPVERYGGAKPSTDAAGGERFLLFDSRGAGWNNDRQSIELAFALAFLWRRTLVLPPYLGYHGHPKDLWQVEDAFDIEAMNSSVKVMFAQEFVTYAKANADRFPGGSAAVSKLGICKKGDNSTRLRWKQWPGWFKGLEGVAETVFKDIPELIPYVLVSSSPGSATFSEEDVLLMPEFKAFATYSRLKKLLMLSESEVEATALHLHPRFLLGNFYTHIYVPDPVVSWQLRSAVKRAVHMRAEYFVAAAAAMNVAGLKPGEFAAIHNRQGDFENVYKRYYLDPSKPEQFLADPQNRYLIQSFGRLYMASKTTRMQAKTIREIFLPGLLQVMPEPREIYGLAGELDAAARAIAGHLPNWRGIVEMIICSQAAMFVGSYASTYTGYIHRLRGYNIQITDKRFLYTDSRKVATMKLTAPSWAEAPHAAVIGWQREWPEGFQIS